MVAFGPMLGQLLKRVFTTTDFDKQILLRGVYRDWVDTLRRGIDRNLQEPGPYRRVYTPAGGGPKVPHNLNFFVDVGRLKSF